MVAFWGFILLGLLLNLNGIDCANDEHVAEETTLNGVDTSDDSNLDPEAYMQAAGIIRYHGYPVEEYDITTPDGYILSIQRIPYGKMSGPGTGSRQPVIVQHGLGCDSDIWVVNTPDKNLAYILAEEGYDVWLTNSRGNKYGRRHKTLDPDHDAFWQFSHDEMAKYDMPTTIDFILDKTGFNQTHYIGHSMGTTIMFAMLASLPEYNVKVRHAVAMGPATTLVGMKSPIRLLAQFKLEFLRSLFEGYEVTMKKNAVDFFLSIMCKFTVPKELCTNLLFVLTGINQKELNVTRIPVFLRHVPSPTSLANLFHFIQNLLADRFQMYDFGAEVNLKVYGEKTPPEYKLEKITTPISLFWSDGDILTSPEQTAQIAPKIKNLVVKYRVPDSKFTHVDYMWALHAKMLVYEKVMFIMKKMWPKGD